MQQVRFGHARAQRIADDRPGGMAAMYDGRKPHLLLRRLETGYAPGSAAPKSDGRHKLAPTALC